MSDKEQGGLAKPKLQGAETPEWRRDYHALNKKLEELQSELKTVKDTYLPRPWKNVETEHQRPYSLHSNILNSVNLILGFRLDDFYKENAGNDVERAKSFEDERWAIKGALELAEFLKNTPQKDIVNAPLSTLLQLNESAAGVAECLRKMRDLTSSPVSPQSYTPEQIKEIQDQKQFWAANFYGVYQNFYNAASPIKTDLYSSDLHILKEQVQRLTDENTKEGIKKHDALYRKQARSHYIAGWFWFVIGLAGVAVACAYGTITVSEIETFAEKVGKEGGIPTEALISIASVRVFIFGLLASVIFWSFKNYRLNKHNELLNRQKELALTTFTEFANAAVGDNEMRRIVLGKVAATIFDAQHLGYIGAETKESGDPVSVLSALESLIKAKQ